MVMIYGKGFKPEDQYNGTWRDLDIFMSLQPDGDVKVDIDKDAVINSINNIIMTARGERRMLPEFAQSLRDILFEPMDEITARRIGELIYYEIQRWEPRVVIQNLNINPFYDSNLYEITIRMNIKGIEDEVVVETTLKRTGL